MNEIEKLYENVKVYDFRYDCDVSFTDGQFGRITNCSKGEVKDYCTDKKYFKSAKVINYKRLYPPFTAEKQLSLIKWLSEQYTITTRYMTSAWFITAETSDVTRTFIKYTITANTFEETIASAINCIWSRQDLTSEEKEQIRSVLNG